MIRFNRTSNTITNTFSLTFNCKIYKQSGKDINHLIMSSTSITTVVNQSCYKAKLQWFSKNHRFVIWR